MASVKARWKGGNPAEDPNAEFIEGVPARSLDEDEFDALDAEQRKVVRESKLYDVRSERDSEPRRASEARAEAPASATTDKAKP